MSGQSLTTALACCGLDWHTLIFWRAHTLPGEPDPDPTTRLQTEPTPVDDSDRLDAARSGQLRPWGHSDRNRLLLWVGIAFLLQVPVVLALRLPVIPTGSVFTVQTELLIKIIAAFFVLLATWIVSRMEKRPLADYGIPPRRAFGRRFWEGSAWGFAALSAILLVLHLSGHFRVDSVALARDAAFRYALGWAGVFSSWAEPRSLRFAASGSFLSPDACVSGRLRSSSRSCSVPLI